MSKSKKAFDLSRDSIYTADPTKDLCIQGGKGILGPDEAGPLDTETGPEVSVKDARRLKKALNAEFKANIKAFGVKVPIIIGKINDVATVIAGKRRVRALRAGNRLRKENGEPLLKVRCVMQRDTSVAAIMSTVVDENSGRQDDDLDDRIEKANVMLDAGMDEADVAARFQVKVTTLRLWLKFHDTATDATKKAVKDGRLNASAAAEVAQILDPTEQDAFLEKMLSAPSPKARSARAAKAARRGKQGAASASDRKSQQLLLKYIQQKDHRAGTSEKTLAFWEGGEEMLKIVLGEKASDERLVKALSEAREMPADTDDTKEA